MSGHRRIPEALWQASSAKPASSRIKNKMESNRERKSLGWESLWQVCTPAPHPRALAPPPLQGQSDCCLLSLRPQEHTCWREMQHQAGRRHTSCRGRNPILGFLWQCACVVPRQVRRTENRFFCQELQHHRVNRQHSKQGQTQQQGRGVRSGGQGARGISVCYES